jgi:hypothetical protein
MFRELDKAHPRLSQTAKDVVPVDLTAASRQSFSESALKQHSSIWYVREEQAPFNALLFPVARRLHVLLYPGTKPGISGPEIGFDVDLILMGRSRGMMLNKISLTP